MKRIDPYLEKMLVGLLIVSVFIPLLLTLFFHFFGTPNGLVAKVLANQCLKGAGIQNPTTPLVYGWSQLRSGQLQKQIADDFNLTFGGRELAIRLADEVYFRIFRVSPIKSADIVVGKGGDLYERRYLEEYCLDRVETGDLMPLVQQLKRLQDACLARGMGFVLVITPSKASIMPEDIPTSWKNVMDPRPRAYDLFLPLVQKEGIRYVDGHALAEECRSSSPTPVFPLGGVHWNYYVALQTTNQVLLTLRAEGKSVAPLTYHDLGISDAPKGQDSDLVSLMNLGLRWHFPVTRLEVNSQEKSSAPSGNLTMVGGSFLWKMAELINASRQLSEVDFYYYYKVFKACYGAGESGDCRYLPAQDLDFDGDFFATDSLVLEINEQVLPSTRNHLTEFVADALNHLPKATDPRKPFPYESFWKYSWGTDILFADPVASRNIDGFFLRGFEGPYLEGDAGSIRLNLAPLHRDAVLKVGLDLNGPKLGADFGLAVLFNGQKIGRWNTSATGPAQLEYVVPEVLLEKGGPAVVTFQLDPPAKAQDSTGGASLRFNMMKLELPPRPSFQRTKGVRGTGFEPVTPTVSV